MTLARPVALAAGRGYARSVSARPARRWIAAAGAVAALLLWFGGTAHAECRVVSRTMDACCCPHARPTHRAPASPDPVLGRAGCCELRVATFDHPTPARVGPSLALSAIRPVLATTPSAPPPAIGLARAVAPARGRGPPGNAHDHLLAKCARLL